MPKSWNSPEMDQIEKKWDTIWKEYEKTPQSQQKKEYYRLTKKSNDLIRSNLNDKDVYHLASTCDALPPNINDRNEFENVTLSYIVEALVTIGDREKLVELLSKRSPDSMGIYEKLEFHLAYQGKKLRDPILILGEAYTKCKSADVRRALVVAMRRGFAGHGVEGKDDSEFVENAMQWYKEKKDSLTVNEKYAFNLLSFPWDSWVDDPRGYERDAKGRNGFGPLFLEKK